MAYLLLAGLSTPLVLSVHSVVSFDFATSVIPGWHTTIFPPYFVAGAIFGGFAMVLTIMIPACALYKPLHDLVTISHVDKMCKVIVFTGSIVGYAYLMELFMAWYSANPYERAAFLYRATGPYWWAYFCMMFCNVVAPQLFWFKYFRTHLVWVWIIVQFPNAGMWYERFVIIATTLARDFTPSAWGMFHPTWVDITMFIGSLGLFFTLFLLFIRFLPMICMFEVKAVLPEADPHHGGKH
jgi:molybdopterin-containing oxidoreductase family membrane subunit